MSWKNLSRILHDLIYRDVSQSLCSRAWGHRAHPFWAAWVWIFGAAHCEQSHQWYHKWDTQ